MFNLLLFFPILYISTFSNIPYDSILLTSAAQKYNIVALQNSKFEAKLIPICRSHVISMINRNKVDHLFFEQRVEQIRKLTGQRGACVEVTAIVPASNDYQKDAKILLETWKRSQPHWKVLNKKSKSFCFSMGYSKNRCWGIGVFIAEKGE